MFYNVAAFAIPSKTWRSMQLLHHALIRKIICNLHLYSLMTFSKQSHKEKTYRFSNSSMTSDKENVSAIITLQVNYRREGASNGIRRINGSTMLNKRPALNIIHPHPKTKKERLPLELVHFPQTKLSLLQPTSMKKSRNKYTSISQDSQKSAGCFEGPNLFDLPFVNSKIFKGTRFVPINP